MIPPEIRPYKADAVEGRLSMLDAYKRDIDFWGNGERKLFHTVTKSLVDFFKTTELAKNTFVFWCDVGCGPGYFLEGLKAVLEEKLGPDLIPSGVDISPEAIRAAGIRFNSSDFIVTNLDDYKRLEGNFVMPWINADVISFIDTLQYFKDYRRTFNEICDGVKVGTYIVVADGMGRSNMRDYAKSLDTMALVGEWIDRSMAVTPRDPAVPNSKNRYYVYRVYRKML